MVGLMMPLKDRLKSLRAKAGLTQQALAMKAGLSMASVIHLEAGRTPDPRGSTLKALARALGVTVDELLGDDDETESAPEPPADQGGARRGRKGKK